MKEIWKRTLDCKEYEISNFGRIRSQKNNRIKILKPTPGQGGRLFISLSENNIRWNVAIHRLVLDTFVGPKPKGFHASHLNGNFLDNRIENLKWETPKQNCARKKQHGTWQIGEKAPSAKLKNNDIVVIKRLRSEGLSSLQIGWLFGVSKSTIKNAISGKTFSLVPV